MCLASQDVIMTPGTMRWLVNGQVLDVRTGEFRRSDVGIDGERIAAVVDAGLGGPGDRLDGEGLYILPGLIDCHVHLVMRGEDPDPAANAARSDDEIREYAMQASERTLLGGVTSVRDLGGWNYVEMDVRSAIDRGEIIGPRLFLAGRLLSAPTPAVEYYPGMYEVASDPGAVAEAARAQFEKGADLIKVMASGAMLSPEDEDARQPQLGREAIGAAVAVARSHGGHVAAHAHALEGIRNAVEAGAASIEHCSFADEEIASEMARRDVFVVATMSAFATSMLDEGSLRKMPPHIHRRFVESESVHTEAIRQAYLKGAPQAMGTDAGTPGNHHGANAQECVLLVEEVGLSPIEAIRAATLDAARLLGRAGRLGVIAAGAYADLVGCRENPLQDIQTLTSVPFVMKSGSEVKAEPRSSGTGLNGM
jgi:imidazolonepropionase-like amidohydrolase